MSLNQQNHVSDNGLILLFSPQPDDVSYVTSISAEASSYDERPLLEGGCYKDGCTPDLSLVSLVHIYKTNNQRMVNSEGRQ